MWVTVNGYLINTRYLTLIELTDEGNCLCHFPAPVTKPPTEHQLEIAWNDRTHAFWDWMMKRAYKPLQHPWMPSDLFRG